MSDSQVIDNTTKIIRAKGKRGGQPGNTNALRHGYYARNLGMSSPSKLKEEDMRNLLGEAAMIKDYMFILYNCNLEIRDSMVLAETLRALSLAGMALARLLQVHCQVRVHESGGSSSLDALLGSMQSATSRANALSTNILGPDADDDD